MTKDIWIFGNEPKESGWYAATVCWDIEEGLFPVSAYYNADEDMWAGYNNQNVVAYFGPFTTSQEAEIWAYAHDMEGV